MHTQIERMSSTYLRIFTTCVSLFGTAPTAPTAPDRKCELSSLSVRPLAFCRTRASCKDIMLEQLIYPTVPRAEPS